MSNKKKDKKKGNKQQAQIKPTCIFCGGSPLTNEHHWPSWMHPMIVENRPSNVHPNKKNFRFSEYEQKIGQAHTFNQTNETKSGPVESRKVKVVCSPCNNEWMSDIETEAMPILTTLIRGESINIRKKEKEIISRWMYLKTIIGEYTSEVNKIINKTERTTFYNTKQVPENWLIWIAKIDPPMWAIYHGQPVGGLNATVQKTGEDVKIICSQNLMVADSLVLYAATFPRYIGDALKPFDLMILGDYGENMKKIHPEKSIFSRFLSFKWNKVKPILYKNLDDLRSNIQDYANTVKVHLEMTR